MRILSTLLAGLSFLVIGSGPAGAERFQATSKPSTAKVLFGLNATSGLFTPTGQTDQYTLSLAGVSAETTWFTDRPLRQADSVPTATALDMIGFSEAGEGPPNAVVTFHLDAAHGIVAVALRNPAYSAAAATLTFQATLLRKPDNGLSGFDLRLDRNPPTTFSAASLFIDDLAVTISPGGQPVPQSPSPNGDCRVVMGSVYWANATSLSNISCEQVQRIATQFGHPQVQCQNYQRFEVATAGTWTCQDQGGRFPYAAAAGNRQFPDARFYLIR